MDFSELAREMASSLIRSRTFAKLKNLKVYTRKEALLLSPGQRRHWRPHAHLVASGDDTPKYLDVTSLPRNVVKERGFSWIHLD